MAEQRSFRGALGGFNRQDVVRYIEYLNAKHTGIVNQLNNEKQALLDELAALQAKLTQLNGTQPEQPEAEAEKSLSEVDALREQLAQVTAQRDAALANSKELAAEELEAYRRAERMERAAKERSEQMYRLATATLADATTQVDQAAIQFRLVADKVNAQMLELQTAVDGSKAALLEAASTMYTIRPEGLEE